MHFGNNERAVLTIQTSICFSASASHTVLNWFEGTVKLLLQEGPWHSRHVLKLFAVQLQLSLSLQVGPALSEQTKPSKQMLLICMGEFGIFKRVI